MHQTSNTAAPRTQAAPQYAVQVTTPAPRTVWRELCSLDPEALPSQSPEWLDCVCALRGCADASRLYTFADGQQLILPLVRRKSVPAFLSILASMPHAWGWGGVVSRYTLKPCEIVAVFSDLNKQRFLSLRINPNPRQSDVWQTARPTEVLSEAHHSHIVDLTCGFEAVWQERFSKTTRRMIQKAKNMGVVVEVDTTGKLVPVFYELFLRSVDRWAKQQHEPRWLAHRRAERRDPLNKIAYFAHSLKEACQVWVARHDGTPVSAAVVFSGKNADYALGAMDKERAAPVYANYLLHKHIIEEACRNGCHFYHMGESGTSAGISNFKERFGAQSYFYNDYRLERFPISKVDQIIRRAVKRTVGFKDV